jgi:hypothetical protein
MLYNKNITEQNNINTENTALCCRFSRFILREPENKENNFVKIINLMDLWNHRQKQE